MNVGPNKNITGTDQVVTDEGTEQGIEMDLTLGQEEVFARKGSIARSPPRGTASLKTPVAKMSHQDSNVTEAQTSSARHSRLNAFSQMKRCNSYDSGKKMDSSLDPDQEVVARSDVGDPTIFVLAEALELISKCSKDLDVKILENPNTKREIKEIACKLKRGVEVINRRAVKGWLEARKLAQLGTTKYDIDTQTECSKQPTSRGEGKTISTQTEMDEAEGGTLAPGPAEARREAQYEWKRSRGPRTFWATTESQIDSGKRVLLAGRGARRGNLSRLVVISTWRCGLKMMIGK